MCACSPKQGTQPCFRLPRDQTLVQSTFGGLNRERDALWKGAGQQIRIPAPVSSRSLKDSARRDVKVRIMSLLLFLIDSQNLSPFVGVL
jgi:hypothetical protein